MTFTELVNEVAERLNLTSASAITRIGREVNERYKWLVTSMSLDVTTRSTTTANTVIGNRYVTFTSTLKIVSVFIPTLSPIYVLGELTFDELRNRQPLSDPPQNYAIARMGANTVTIFLDCIPSTIYSLSADTDEITTTLSGSAVPAFDENFHNILIYGPMATELEKMEKYDLAAKQEAAFEQRVSELRIFIAKSAYLDIYQAKTRNGGTWYNTVPLV